MKHSIDTGLDKPTAKRAIQKAMEAYQVRFADYEPRFAWTSEEKGELSFKAKGLKIAGTIVLRDQVIDVDMQVPLLLRVFQGKAMQVIEEEVNRWVDKVTRGEA